MPDFSNTPDEALRAALDQGYVAARVKKGVPVLDRDLNLLGELPAAALRRVVARYLGDGVVMNEASFRVSKGEDDLQVRVAPGAALIGGLELRCEQAQDLRLLHEPENSEVDLGGFFSGGAATGARASTRPGEGGGAAPLPRRVWLVAALGEQTEAGDPALMNPDDLGFPTSTRQVVRGEVKLLMDDAPAPAGGIPLATLRWDSGASLSVTDLRPIGLSLGPSLGGEPRVAGRLGLRNAAGEETLRLDAGGEVPLRVKSAGGSHLLSLVDREATRSLTVGTRLLVNAPQAAQPLAIVGEGCLQSLSGEGGFGVAVGDDKLRFGAQLDGAPLLSVTSGASLVLSLGREPDSGRPLLSLGGEGLLEEVGLSTSGLLFTRRDGPVVSLGTTSGLSLRSGAMTSELGAGTLRLRAESEGALVTVGVEPHVLGSPAVERRLHLGLDARARVCLNLKDDEAEADLTPGGVYVKGAGGREARLYFDGMTLEDASGRVVRLEAASGRLEVGGALLAERFDTRGGNDCAERLPTLDPSATPPGAVVVWEDDAVAPCRREGDRRVVGVVSGAGGLRPGLLLGEADGAPVALAGRVWCQADARGAPIAVGDLLTTAQTPGHARRADPAAHAGAVIGKALSALEGGLGLVHVLVTLS